MAAPNASREMSTAAPIFMALLRLFDESDDRRSNDLLRSLRDDDAKIVRARGHCSGRQAAYLLDAAGAVRLVQRQRQRGERPPVLQQFEPGFGLRPFRGVHG